MTTGEYIDTLLEEIEALKKERDLYESEDMLKTAISESFPGTVVSGTLQLDQVQARTFYDVYDEDVIIDGDMYQ